MAKLTDELKNEHVTLVNILNKVNELGLSSKEGQDKLLSAKSGLISHLQKEDRDLYPVLNRAAQTNDNLKRTLDTFAKDMSAISQEALGFFDKYSKGGSASDFARDFRKLFATLGGRIRKEESILYPEFDKLAR